MISLHHYQNLCYKFISISFFLGNRWNFDNFSCSVKFSIFLANLRYSPKWSFSNLLYVNVILQITFILNFNKLIPLYDNFSSLFLFLDAQSSQSTFIGLSIIQKIFVESLLLHNLYIFLLLLGTKSETLNNFRFFTYIFWCNIYKRTFFVLHRVVMDLCPNFLYTLLFDWGILFYR